MRIVESLVVIVLTLAFGLWLNRTDQEVEDDSAL